jgi:hypothetical protein
VDKLDLAVVLPVRPPACAALQAAEDYVDQPLGCDQAVGVACLQRGRQVALLATILRWVVVTSPVVAALVILAATSVVAAVVAVAT